MLTMDMQHCTSGNVTCYRDVCRGPLDATSLVPRQDYDVFERLGGSSAWYMNDAGIYDGADNGPLPAQPYPCPPPYPMKPASSPTTTTCSSSFVPSSPTISASSPPFSQRSPGHVTSPSSMFDAFLDSSMSYDQGSVRGDLSPSSEKGFSSMYTSSSSNESTPEKSAGSPRDGAGSDGSRSKRRPYSKLQLIHLEEEFKRSMYPSRERRALLSQVLELTERQVKIWFQNRRTKLRRTVEREQRENEQMQRDMADLAMRFYAPQ